MGWREELFTSPGTWVNPGTVTSVRITAVGGGGGGAPGASVPQPGNCPGGGGAVLERVVQVSGPQSVVVGAGGTAWSPGPTPATVGGDSTFGAPGPTQIIAGGGGAGGGGTPNNAPPNGGGGGAPGGLGTHGYPGLYNAGGGMGGIGGGTFKSISGPGDVKIYGWHWYDNKYRFSAGGFTSAQMYDGLLTPTTPNYSGDGGVTTGSGQAGCVIVRWFE